MRKIFSISIGFYFFIEVLSFAQTNTQYGWQWLNPLPTLNSITRIKYADQNTGYAVGNYSTVIKTTDGGNSWLFLETWNLVSRDTFNILQLFNKDTLIAGSSSSGFIYKSTNGGVNWTLFNTGMNCTLEDIYFRNALTGYVIGDHSNLSRTTDGGYSWINLPIHILLPTSSISFPDDNTGYISGNNKVLRTTNAGINWDTSSIPIYNGRSAIYFLNNLTGFIAIGEIFKTSNGGINWLDVGAGGAISQICFLDTATGWASGSNGIWKTTNGGNNWNLINPSSWVGPIYFLNYQTGYSCSYGVTMRKTTNGGTNWNTISYSLFGFNDIYSIFFINSNTGYVSGPGVGFYKTTNSGLNWSGVSWQGANKIYFFNENTGFIGKNDNGQGAVSKTTDGGYSWSPVNVQNLVFNLCFVDINTGFAVGSSGLVIKTINSGQSWSQIYSGTGWFYSIYFLDVNFGFAVGEDIYAQDALFLSTTNGGINWNTQITNWGGSCGHSVYFVNYNTGYVACNDNGVYGRIYKTTDAGVNWVLQSIGNPGLYNIQFFDLNTGIASGSNGKVVKTTNGGTNWIDICPVTDVILRDMCFLNSNTGYICGQSGLILKISNGGTLVDVQKKEFTVLKNFSLYQNYPNPFNPTTKIKFEIPTPVAPLYQREEVPINLDGGFMTLKIYDILGHEIAALVNEKLSPGTYEVEFDGRNYPSGVYFYKLISVDFTQTKKMVLIK